MCVDLCTDLDLLCDCDTLPYQIICIIIRVLEMIGHDVFRNCMYANKWYITVIQ